MHTSPSPYRLQALALLFAYILFALQSAAILSKLYLAFTGFTSLVFAVACPGNSGTVQEALKPFLAPSPPPTPSTPLGPSPTLPSPGSLSGQVQWLTFFGVAAELAVLLAVHTTLGSTLRGATTPGHLRVTATEWWLALLSAMPTFGVAAPQPPPPPPPPPASPPLPLYDIVADRALRLLGIILTTVIYIITQLDSFLRAVALSPAPSWADLAQALFYALTIGQCFPSMVRVSLLITVPSWLNALSALFAFLTALFPSLIRAYVCQPLSGPIILRLSDPQPEAEEEAGTKSVSVDEGTLVQPGTPSPFASPFPWHGKKKIWLFVANSSPFRTPSRPPPRRRSPLAQALSPVAGGGDDTTASMAFGDLSASGPAAGAVEDSVYEECSERRGVDGDEDEDEDEEFVTVLEQPEEQEAPVEDTLSLGELCGLYSAAGPEQEYLLDMSLDLAGVQMDSEDGNIQSVQHEVEDVDTLSLGDLIGPNSNVYENENLLAMDGGEGGFVQHEVEDVDTLSLEDLLGPNSNNYENENLLAMDGAEFAGMSMSMDSEDGDGQFVSALSHVSVDEPHVQDEVIAPSPSPSVDEDDSPTPAPAVSGSYLPLFASTPLSASASAASLFSAEGHSRIASWAQEVQYITNSQRIARFTASHVELGTTLRDFALRLREAVAEFEGEEERAHEEPPSPTTVTPPRPLVPRLRVIQASPCKDQEQENVILVSPCRGADEGGPGKGRKKRRTRGGFPSFLESAVSLSLSSISSVTSLPSLPSVTSVSVTASDMSEDQEREQERERGAEAEAKQEEDDLADTSLDALGRAAAQHADASESLMGAAWPPPDFPTDPDTSDEWARTPEMEAFWKRREERNPRAVVDVDAYSLIGDLDAEDRVCDFEFDGRKGQRQEGELEEEKCVSIEEMMMRMGMELPIPLDYACSRTKAANEDEEEAAMDLPHHLPPLNTSYNVSARRNNVSIVDPEGEIPMVPASTTSYREEMSRISMFTLSTPEHWEAVCAMYGPRDAVTTPANPSPPPSPPSHPPPPPTSSASAPLSPPAQTRSSTPKSVSSSLDELHARTIAMLNRIEATTAKSKARRLASAHNPAPVPASTPEPAPAARTRTIRPRPLLRPRISTSPSPSDSAPTITASTRVSTRRSLPAPTLASGAARPSLNAARTLSGSRRR